MDILLDWAGYLARWGHVMAGITWIGTSFYFNWLDLSERPPVAPTLKPNVQGEVHEMHGGSYYYHERYWPTEPSKRMLNHSGPAQLTFLTGVLLVVLIYWLGASVYLVQPLGEFIASVGINPDQCRDPVRALYRLRSDLQEDLEQQGHSGLCRHPDPSRWLCRPFGFQRPGRVLARWRNAGHHHGAERLFCDHPQPHRDAGPGQERPKC